MKRPKLISKVFLILFSLGLIISQNTYPTNVTDTLSGVILEQITQLGGSGGTPYEWLLKGQDGFYYVVYKHVYDPLFIRIGEKEFSPYDTYEGKPVIELIGTKYKKVTIKFRQKHDLDKFILRHIPQKKCYDKYPSSCEFDVPLPKHDVPELRVYGIRIHK